MFTLKRPPSTSASTSIAREKLNVKDVEPTHVSYGNKYMWLRKRRTCGRRNGFRKLERQHGTVLWDHMIDYGIFSKILGKWRENRKDRPTNPRQKKFNWLSLPTTHFPLTQSLILSLTHTHTLSLSLSLSLSLYLALSLYLLVYQRSNQ